MQLSYYKKVCDGETTIGNPDYFCEQEQRIPEHDVGLCNKVNSSFRTKLLFLSNALNVQILTVLYPVKVKRIIKSSKVQNFNSLASKRTNYKY